MLRDETVHCIVTSPPYWGLRDYGVDGQIGLESTPEEYVSLMVDVFRAVRRVLREDGTLWLNLGDSYAGSWGAQGRNGEMANHSVIAARQIAVAAKKKSGTGSVTHRSVLKPKDLVGIPWRVAFALQVDGWYLRSDIIWAKPNPMPESVQDRPTRAHEYLFLFSKRRHYLYDRLAVAEETRGCWEIDKTPSGWDTSVGKGGHGAFHRDGREAGKPYRSGNKERVIATGEPGQRPADHRGSNVPWEDVHGRRNRRSVWEIPTEPFPGAHFATFPRRLVEPCILAGTSKKGVCERCGAPVARVVKTEYRNDTTTDGRPSDGNNVKSGQEEGARTMAVRTRRIDTTVDWKPGCKCGAGFVPATVLDPFSGSGTTGIVALGLGRSYIGIEISPEYVAMSRKRLEDAQPLFAREQQ